MSRFPANFTFHYSVAKSAVAFGHALIDKNLGVGFPKAAVAIAFFISRWGYFFIHFRLQIYSQKFNLSISSAMKLATRTPWCLCVLVERNWPVPKSQGNPLLEGFLIIFLFAAVVVIYLTGYTIAVVV